MSRPFSSPVRIESSLPYPFISYQPQAETIERFTEARAFLRKKNYLWKARLSRGPVIWLLAPSPPLQSVSLTGDTQEDGERRTICRRKRGGARAWSWIRQMLESLVLYKLFNPFCPQTIYAAQDDFVFLLHVEFGYGLVVWIFLN